MEGSAPKRRRTSPRTSIPLHQGTQSQQEHTNESTTPPDPPPSTRSNRPSFASPTKSSLARHNPQILQRQRHPSRGKDDAPPSASRPSSQGSNAANIPSAQPEQRSGDVAAGSEAASQGDPRSTGPENSRRSPTRRIGGALAERPRRTPTRPKPRPLPPPGPEEEEDLFNPFGGRALRRSGLGVLPNDPPPEPELPPTPEHPDPEITTPPSGIHNTPSKRSKRSKGINLHGGSPLKPPPSKMRDLARRPSPAKEVPKQLQAQPLRRRSARLNADLQEPQPDPARGVAPIESDPKKAKLRDKLLANIQQLEADLALAKTENERVESFRAPRSEVTPPTNREEILGVLRRHALSKKEREIQPDLSLQWLQATLNPISFLPFSKPGATLPTLFSTGSDKDDEKVPVSHHPTVMTAEEEVPYLQAFTPLTFNSFITILTPPADTPDAPTLQRHSISVSSASPPGIFAARIEMTVNTKTHAITDLAVPKLDPSAIAELNPLIERILSKDEAETPQSSGLTRNVSILTWAMGDWFRVALKRARFWVLLDRELGSKEAFAESVARIRNRPRRKRRRKEAAEDEEQQQEAGVVVAAAAAEVSREEILPHLGRMAMDVDLPNNTECAVRVQWRVEFDWSGEAQSKVGILLGIPGKWHKADDRGKLGGIPKMFDELVHDDTDPMDAVRTVAALLAGDVPA